MKSNTTTAIIVLIVLSISLSVALSDTDKAIIKLATISAMDDTGKFSYTNADIGWDNSLDIWFISKNVDQDSVIKDLEFIVGAYLGACIKYPGLSDLDLFVGTKENTEVKMYCERSWVDEVDVDSEGNMDTTSAGLLVLRVLGTIVKTS